MSPEHILQHVRREPFEPFRVFLSDGKVYEVRHPEMILVSRREVVIAIASGNGGLPDHTAFCDPLHVTRIEVVGDAASRRQAE
jgi:hypothetical protein